MALVVGPNLYPATTQSADQPSPTYDLLDTVQSSISFTNSVGTGTQVAGVKLVPPNTTRTDLGIGDGVGWGIAPTSGMNNTSSTAKKIAAGNWTITVPFTQSSPGNNGTQLSWYLYKRGANGSYTLLGQASSGNNLNASGTFAPSIALGAITLNPGETIESEFVQYVSPPVNPALNNTLTTTLGGSGNPMVMPSAITNTALVAGPQVLGPNLYPNNTQSSDPGATSSSYDLNDVPVGAISVNITNPNANNTAIVYKWIPPTGSTNSYTFGDGLGWYLTTSGVGATSSTYRRVPKCVLTLPFQITQSTANANSQSGISVALFRKTLQGYYVPLGGGYLGTTAASATLTFQLQITGGVLRPGETIGVEVLGTVGGGGPTGTNGNTMTITTGGTGATAWKMTAPITSASSSGPFLSRGYYYAFTSTQSDNLTGIFDLKATDGLQDGLYGSTLQISNITGASGVGANGQYFQIFPKSGTAGIDYQSGLGSAQQANSKGWIIPIAAEMGGSSSVSRILRAGSALVSFNAFFINATSTTAQAQSIWATWYKRSSTGTLTLISQGTTSVTSSAIGTASNPSIQSSPSSDIYFGSGESLYVELYLYIPGETATAGKANIGWYVGPNQQFSINYSNGISFFYTPNIAESLTTTDAVTRTGTFPRALSETLTTTDVTKRTINNSRTIIETLTTSDSPTRTASHPRAISETLVTSDSPTRMFTANRAISETLTTTDVVMRRFTGARAISEVLTTSDAVTRLLTYGRFIAEYPPGLTPDYKVTFPTKQVSGYVRNQDGSVFTSNAMVNLIRSSDGKLCQTTTSAADGSYSFPRDKFDPYTYHVEAFYTAGSVAQQGTTQDNLPPF